MSSAITGTRNEDRSEYTREESRRSVVDPSDCSDPWSAP